LSTIRVFIAQARRLSYFGEILKSKETIIMFIKGIKFVLMSVALLLLTSCASSKRMMRLSPFASKDPIKIDYDESHVNLWPFFYNKGSFYSVLWPMIDSDWRGFAVRPFYNQDRNEYSILFPLSAWNPHNGDGWALNTYWKKKYIGSFPLFHLGDEKKFNYILPVWWADDWKSFGIVGAGFSDKLNFVGPLWFNTEDSCGGIFPIFHQEGGKNGWLFPLYNYKNTKDRFYLNLIFGVLGRFAYSPEKSHYRFATAFYINKYRNHYQGFLPLYYYQRKRNKKLLLTPLGGSSWNREAENISTYILNAFYVNKRQNNYHGIVPLYYYENWNKQKLLVTPLGGYGWDAKTGDNSFVNVLGPLYFRSRNKKENTMLETFCWPLYINSKKPEERNIGSFPLFWYTKGKNDGSFNILGPLYYHSYDKLNDKSRYLVLWPLSFYMKNKSETNFGSFPLFWSNKNNDRGFLNILGPVYHHSWKKDRSFYSVLWPLSFYSKGKYETDFGSFPLFWYNKGKDSGFFNLLGLLWDYRWNERNWRVGSLLMLGGITHQYYDDYGLPGETDPRIIMSGRCGRFCNNTLKEKFSFWVFPFYFYDKRKHIAWKKRADRKSLDEVGRALQKLYQLNSRIRKPPKNDMSVIEPPLKKLTDMTYVEHQIEINKVTPLLKKLDVPVLDLTDNKAIEKTRQVIRDKYCTSADSKRISVPLLYSYDEFDDDYKWDVFWFLANGKKEGGYEKISILRYLYCYEKSGGVVSRTIFPFMTYKSAPEKSKFSFLWRVFNYERKKDEVSGHILFIPF
jgi:hypothetical protein